MISLSLLPSFIQHWKRLPRAEGEDSVLFHQLVIKKNAAFPPAERGGGNSGVTRTVRGGGDQKIELKSPRSRVFQVHVTCPSPGVREVFGIFSS